MSATEHASATPVCRPAGRRRSLRSRFAPWAFLLATPLLFRAAPAPGQTNFDPAARGDRGMRAVFYNVENLFDPSDDPAHRDGEYTPDGDRHWSRRRYRDKLLNLSKVLAGIGGMEAPELVALGEVENWQTVYDLSRSGPLEPAGYRIVHHDSRDPRGIEVALMYRAAKLDLLGQRLVKVPTADGKEPTRDILYAVFRAPGGDTLHVWVNHWPSRLGPESRRLAAAGALVASVDSLLGSKPGARVLLLGDFNDEPRDRSLWQVLGARPPSAEGARLFNLSHAWIAQQRGTIYRRDVLQYWQVFDQVIVSGALLSGAGLQVRGAAAHIYDAPWLLQSGGPKRTHQGPLYLGGFSDHLPVYVDLYIEKP